MPPEIDFKTFSGKRDNAIHVLNELFDKFEAQSSVKPEVNLLAAIYNKIESRYRAIKQIEAIADRFVEDGITLGNDTIAENLKCGEEIKVRYLEISYLWQHVVLGADAEAVKQMTQNNIMVTKVTRSSLERLSLLSWGGRPGRRSSTIG